MPAPALISVRGLAAGGVLHGLDLDLAAGEIVALVGRSGSGKTTLARALLGLVRPSAGTISSAGVPLTYRAAALRAYRRQVGLVPQDPGGALDPRHPVGWTVTEGLRIHRLPVGDRAAEVLAEVGLAERLLTARPDQLSGGERQRVAIAAALAVRPRVLVADEPVSSLDPPARAGILELFLRLRAERGLAVLLITHDLAVAWQAADRLALLADGRIAAAGPVEEVITALPAGWRPARR